MSAFLEDSLNIEIMKEICTGSGVGINISELATKFGKHRNTITTKVNNLLEHEIIERPFYPFQQLFDEWPLLIFEKANLQRRTEINTWIEKDPHIYAAFFVKDEVFNTFLMQLHKDIYYYQQWKEEILENDKLISPDVYGYFPSEVIYLSTKNIIKNNSYAALELLRRDFTKKSRLEINGLLIDELSFKIMESLFVGEGIVTNYNYLSSKVSAHRRTIQKRVEQLIQARIISPPICIFPRLWTSPEYFLVFSLVEIRKYRSRILKSLMDDQHISLLIKANINRYNLVAISNFYKIEEHLIWMEQIDQRFPDSIGAVKNLYLSPQMTFSIAPFFVTEVFLEKKLNELRGKKLEELMS